MTTPAHEKPADVLDITKRVVRGMVRIFHPDVRSQTDPNTDKDTIEQDAKAVCLLYEAYKEGDLQIRTTRLSAYILIKGF